MGQQFYFPDYAYVHNNSVNLIDPLGLTSVAIPGPVPLPLPPVFIPGTLENKQFVNDTINIIKNIFSKGDDAPTPPQNPADSPGEGWEWRGPDPPGGKRGAWHNPDTGESLHPDLDHPAPIGPHWDYTDPNGNKRRLPCH